MDLPLYYASIGGRYEGLNFRQDTNLQQVTCGQGNTILHLATMFGKISFIEELLNTNPSFLHQTNLKGDTALHIAASYGYLQVSSLLITHARSPNVAEDPDLLKMENREKNTALHEAVRSNHFDIVDLLITEDPSLSNSTNDVGDSPLFMAVDRKFYRIARRILRTFPDCSCSGRNGMTVMHAAILRLHFFTPVRFSPFEKRLRNQPLWVQCITMIIFKPIITCTNLAIWGAYTRGSTAEVDFVKAVLNTCGREILEIQDDRGWMPLHYAAHMGNVEVINQFLETNKTLAYIKDKEGMSALHISVRNGSYSPLSILIEKCPDICELLDKRDRTALHVAVEVGFRAGVVQLLNMKAFSDLINEKDIEGNTAFHLAAIHGQYKILTILATHTKTDTEAVNKVGMTVIDIIQSNAQLARDKKDSYLTRLKRKGLQPSLEKRIVLRELPTGVETKGNETAEEIELEASSKNDDRAGSIGVTSSEHVNKFATINLVVATIIASITYAAALTIPGGFNSVDGMAILRTKTSLKLFLAFDSLSFGCSVASMCIHFLSVFASRFIREKYSYPITCVVFLTLVSISSTLVAFMVGTNAVLKHRSGLALPGIIAFTSFILPVSFFFIRIVFLVQHRLLLIFASLR